MSVRLCKFCGGLFIDFSKNHDGKHDCSQDFALIQKDVQRFNVEKYLNDKKSE